MYADIEINEDLTTDVLADDHDLYASLIFNAQSGNLMKYISEVAIDSEPSRSNNNKSETSTDPTATIAVRNTIVYSISVLNVRIIITMIQNVLMTLMLLLPP